MRGIKKMIFVAWMRAGDVLSNDRGISVIELILVLVVVIGLVLIFKSQLTNLVESIFAKIVSESSGI